MLLAILSTLAFMVALFPLILIGIIAPETAALLLIGVLVLRFIASNLMNYILPFVTILIFLWLMGGLDLQGSTNLLGYILVLGIMFFGFLIMIRGFRGR